MKVQFVNLKRQYAGIQEEIEATISKVLSDCAFVQGPYLAKFEEHFAAAHSAPFAIGCSNGTSAISLALEGLGVGAGDEVITVTNTFIATAEAICHVGAKPVFVDCLVDTQQIDPAEVEKAITPETKAIIAVHLFGNLAPVDELKEIADKKGLFLLEDSAQAHLAMLHGKPVGTWGDAATFSFYPGKNLGAYGDAGMIVTHSEALNARVRKLRDHGRISKYEHDTIGYNHRMDGIQAAILDVKLPYLQGWTNQRREVASRYHKAFEVAGIRCAQPTTDSAPVYHLFVIECDRRDEVRTVLNERGVSAGVHYPIPLHLQPAFEYLGGRAGQFPVAEELSRRILSLPICGSITDEEVEYVIQEVLGVCSSQGVAVANG
jgi:dTDP-4-amino-4,6-dideoxygalactose transaminase